MCISKPIPIILNLGKRSITTYIPIANQECKGWKPMLQRLGSYIGFASKWSKSTKMVALIISQVCIHFLLKPNQATIAGTRKWRAMCSIVFKIKLQKRQLPHQAKQSYSILVICCNIFINKHNNIGTVEIKPSLTVSYRRKCKTREKQNKSINYEAISCLRFNFYKESKGQFIPGNINCSFSFWNRFFSYFSLSWCWFSTESITLSRVCPFADHNHLLDAVPNSYW